jgi:hypothetical protein
LSNAYKENLKLIDWSIKAPSQKKAKPEYESKRSHLSAPLVVSDYAAYECPVSGKMIEGRRAHSENLKQTGCRILEKGEFENTKKNGKKDYLDNIEKAVDKAVDEIATQI